MASQVMSPRSIRINSDLKDQLDQAVEVGQRSRFIRTAISDYLEKNPRAKFKRVLRGTRSTNVKTILLLLPADLQARVQKFSRDNVMSTLVEASIAEALAKARGAKNGF